MATVPMAKTQPQKGLQDIFQVRNMPLDFHFRKLGLADKIAVMGTKIPPYLHYSHYYNIKKIHACVGNFREFPCNQVPNTSIAKVKEAEFPCIDSFSFRGFFTL